MQFQTYLSLKYEKRKWFYENFDKEARDFLREEWYSFMNKLSANVLYKFGFIDCIGIRAIL